MGMQSLMRQFSIRTRMVGAIAVVLALLGVVGGTALWAMNSLNHNHEEFVDHAFAENMTLAKLQLALGEVARHEKDMVIAYERPELVTEARARWQASLDGVRQQMQAMLQGEEDEDNVLVRAMATQLDAYVEGVRPVADQLQNNGYDNATVANRMLRRAHEQFAGIQANMDKVAAVLTEEAAALQAEGKATSRLSWWVFAAVLAVAMGVVVPTTLANMQSICRPLDEAQRLATGITQGNLTQRVNATGRDELAGLMAALGEMQSSLARIVGEVRNTTESIGTASAQIASGNQDLSSRTEQAASSLQQTAASVDQITGTVNQSAEAAREASAMAESNATVAARGGEVVGQVVATMDEIHRSSQKINDIIGVIDGIAFQTNILALNAAVEAARAGEQGRGFAVVAGEVRNLAQRSAEAAKEIKGLIEASVDKVSTGTRQVSEAGQTMGEVVANAQRLSSVIGEITRGAQNQSQGIGQVNEAVGHLDQMTQQNAALVEQSAAAAESLKEQAQRLAEVVRVFRVAA